MRLGRPFYAFLASLLIFTAAFLPASASAFCMVWMSDTQHYYGAYAPIFTDMTDWIAENKDALDIRLVLHTGDIVGASRSKEQWTYAREAMGRLDGKVPYLLACGNHDLGKKYASDNFNTFFDPIETQPLRGGFFGDGRSRYALFSAEGRDYIFISLSMGRKSPNEAEYAWANGLLQRYADHIGVILTHSYLYGRGGHTGHGDKIFNRVVAPNPNVWLVLCGHCRGVNRRTEEIDDDGDGLADRTVYELLANYQDAPKGGGGYLRLLTFLEDKVAFVTYSPVLKDYDFYDAPRKDSFTLPLPPKHTTP